MSDIDAIAALRDPVRRRLYEYVAAQDHEVGRNEAADATGLQRTLAAFHLDKLVEAGLLETSSRRLTGRSGPGAGRPAKVYTRSTAERAVSLPARDYRTAAELLAETAEAAGADGLLGEAARARGAAIGRRIAAGTGTPPGAAGLDAVAGILAGRGYEPQTGEAGEDASVRLRNCPFHVLSTEFPPLICGMNLALLEGLLDGLGAGHLEVRMEARPGWCCAVVSKNKNH